MPRLRSRSTFIKCILFVFMSTAAAFGVDARAGEIAPGGFAAELPTEASEYVDDAVFLQKGQARAIALNAPPGQYRMMVKLLASDRSGNEGDTMFGGYRLLMPKIRYRFELDGAALAAEISPRAVRAAGRDADGNGLYTAWLNIAEVVELRADSALSVACDAEGAFVSAVVLLGADEWRAEQLRQSNLFEPGPGRGFGNAWAAAVERPRRPYPLDSLDKWLKALDAFAERQDPAGPPDLAARRAEGRALRDDVAAFIKLRDSAAAETVARGVSLAGTWEQYRAGLYQWLASADAALFADRLAAIEKLRAAVKTESPAGREALFNAKVAEAYAADAIHRLSAAKDAAAKDTAAKSEIFDFEDLFQILNDADKTRHYLAEAEAAAKRPQTAPRFPEFSDDARPAPAASVGEKDDAAAPAKERVRESLCLNGLWDFAPGPGDAPPPAGKYVQVPIPNDSPMAFYNPRATPDHKFQGAYWEVASTPSAWFATNFSPPADWAGQRLILRFEAVMLHAEVYVNGRYAGEHWGGFVPFEIDVTDFAVPGRENRLHVRVESAGRVAMGPPGAKKIPARYLYPMFDAHAYPLNISGDVGLEARAAVRADDVYVRTELSAGRLVVRSTLVNDSGRPAEVRLAHGVLEGGASVLDMPEAKYELAAGERRIVEVSAPFPEPKLWGLGGEYGDPHNRYALRTRVGVGGRDGGGGEVAFTPFAARELSLRGRQLFLNGKPFRLQGDSMTTGERGIFRSNKWYELFTDRARRRAHINLVRHHRFNMIDGLFAASDDAGILSEGEAPWWGLFAPTALDGRSNHRDPVWRENCRDYYVGSMRRYRNSPSMLMFSLENETLNAANHAGSFNPLVTNHDSLLLFREWAAAEAPHILLLNHSHASATDPAAPVAVLHDYDLGARRIADYCAMAEKPVVIGEFWNPEMSRAIHFDEAQAAGAERQMALWLERAVKAYWSAGVDGVMPYTFGGLGGLSSRRAPEAYGPWGDLIMAKPRQVFSAPIHWPAQNGRGGIRLPKAFLDGYLMRFPTNFFDPGRPAATPTQVADAYAKVFSPLPEMEVRRSPELLVEVRENGAPRAGINVFLESAFADRSGMATDADGKAWFVLELAGGYAVSVEDPASGKVRRLDLNLEATPLGAPGWDYLPRVVVDFAEEAPRFVPGRAAPEAGDANASAREAQSAPKAASGASVLRRDKRVDASRAPVGPDGFIRRWLALGPFPNRSGRDRAEPDDLEADFLAEAAGGEAGVLPALGAPPVAAVFPERPDAYWSAGRLEASWDWFCSDRDAMDLSGAFLADRPGLDGMPQFIIGYLATYLYSDEAQDAVIALGSDDGVKLRLNGEVVGKIRAYRGVKLDQDRFPVRLRKGWNLLLVKIEQETGGFGLALRLLDSDGQALRLRSSLAPPMEPVLLKPGAAVRDWMLLGPFSNPGERPLHPGLDADALGGEAGASPDAGEAPAVFKAHEKAFHGDLTLINRWTPHRSPDDLVDLGRAFTRPDAPGLDVAPVQYAAGYAYTEIDVPEAGEYTLEIDTYNGVKVFVNGEAAAVDAEPTFNRDPNSPVLPPSKRKSLSPRVRLRKGKNVILLKLCVDYGPLDFVLKIK